MSRSSSASSASTSKSLSLEDLNAESSRLRSQIASEIDEADDPLALYDQFVKWIFDKYPREHLASSGLIELLEEATRRYKEDFSYKSDLRYLKLWTLYASLVDKPSVVYKFILTNGIGTVYALLFEEYALTLERDGRHSAADEVYRAGIQRKARPTERLRKKYDEFRRRKSSKPPAPPPAAQVTLPKVKGTLEADLLRRQPLKNYESPSSTGQSSSIKSSSSAPSVASSTRLSSSSSSGSSRYSHMLAPPVVGKRPERLRLNISLLFTEEGGEYSMPEARARSMGLLGKKWGPPPASELSRESVTSAKVNFNDDGSRSTRNYTSRKSVGGAEPTVTINTKAALADVFGMYNSPEKSMRFATLPGTKHAPVRAVEPVTPLTLIPQTRTTSETPTVSTTTPSFTPFVDENAGRKENAAPPKFKPFVDADPQARQTGLTSAPGRKALAYKDVGAARPAPASKANDSAPPNVFSKVFTPAPKADIQQMKKPPQLQGGGTVFQAVAENAPQPKSKAFTPLIDSQAPFKVFSRPPEKDAVFSKPGAFTPFVDDANPAPARTILGSRTPLGTVTSRRAEEVPQEVYGDDDDEDYQDEPANGDADYEEYIDDYEPSHNAPLGGRFGQFNVMTPITERTMEYTSTGRFSVADSDNSMLVERGFAQPDAIEAAERLAAEDEVSSSESFEEPPSSKRPPLFRLPDEHAAPSAHAFKESPELQAVTAFVEEKTGTLSLSDAVSIAGSFNPPNPCCPFEPSIISTLLSLLPEDPEHHHFPHDSQLLDGLQKFARKQTRPSGSSGRVSSNGQTFPVALGDQRFDVYEKLGEGGFGAVFAARVAKAKAGGSEDDDDDDDKDDGDNEDDDDEDSSRRIAIKVVKPRNVWEFRMLRKVHQVLPARLRASVIHPQALHTFRDESFLVLDLCTQGSLLEMINRAGSAGISQAGACLDELLVAFFTAELLRLLEGLHGAGIIHGDLKIDNCLVRLERVPAAQWAAQYEPEGGGGWHAKGIKLVDFGRALDTRMFPRGQAFIAEWATDARDCVEMREGRPWTFQADYFGLAGIVYCMLYGKYIEVGSIVRAEGGRYKLATPFKRYWQTTLWTRFFDVLLNPGLVRPDGALPVTDALAELRGEIEAWLQANCNRSSNTLKGLLKKVELSVIRGD
ncbi:Mad3/BUB1 homology region 1-domain-containing protein [Gloeopeniophorella convolvens]|nr:Mad3/BUB1 homology region 1-domain-containing protein [Gloeopeniophorella convolvens]